MITRKVKDLIFMGAGLAVTIIGSILDHKRMQREVAVQVKEQIAKEKETEDEEENKEEA